MASLMRTTRVSMGSRSAQDLLPSGGMRQEGPTSNCTSKANLTNVGPMAGLRRCLPHLFNAAHFRLRPPRGAYAKEDLHLPCAVINRYPLCCDFRTRTLGITNDGRPR